MMDLFFRRSIMQSFLIGLALGYGLLLAYDRGFLPGTLPYATKG